MSKELEALQEICFMCFSENKICSHGTEKCLRYKTVEKALEENETLARKSKAYENFFEDVWHLIEKHNTKGVSGLAKFLKALEIIKNTLGIKLFETTEDNTLGETHYYIDIGGFVSYQLKSKEEYELLKEVFSNESNND